MKKFLLAILIIMFSIDSAQPNVKQPEIRATAIDLDSWITSSDYHNRLDFLIKKVSEANFNTIIFQVQNNGRVIWSSDKQPCIIAGGDEIIRSVIKNCRDNGIKCHAWINPYELGPLTDVENDMDHPYNSQSDLCLTQGNLLYLDPGNPSTTDYLIDLYKELVDLFDFDGIVIDRARYPGIDFPDKDSFRTFNSDALPRDRWRRNNVNTFISKFSEMSQLIRPSIKKGAITAGTYLNAPGFTNPTSYNTYFQDAAYWMNAGYVDYIIPEVFYEDDNGFSADIETWITYSSGKNIVPGLAAFNICDANYGWDKETICAMIEKIRRKQQTAGVCLFNIADVVETDLYDRIKNDCFKYSSSVHHMDFSICDKLNIICLMNSIVIQSQESIVSVKLFSLYGQLLKEIYPPVPSSYVTFDNIGKGTYILKIMTAGHNIIVKKIVQ